MESRTRPRSDPALEGRLKWLMFGRLAVGIAGIVAILWARSGEAGSWAPYHILLAACLLNLLYLVLARAGVGRRPLAAFQLVLDLLLVGGLTYLTGIDRFFAFLDFAVVIAAAALLGVRSAVAMASGASIILAVVSTLYFLASSEGALSGLPFTDPGVVAEYGPRRGFVLPYLFFFALSLHVVALLAGRLTAEVRHARILTEEILENIAAGVLAADGEGRIQFLNVPAAGLLGLKGTDGFRGMRLEEVLPRDLSEFLRRSGGQGERAAREFTLKGVPVRVGVSSLPEGGGGRKGLVAILTDLSLHARVEEMGRQADRFRALLEMSAAMAHEIRNPLASIRGAAQELDSGSATAEDDRKLLQVVVRESDRLDEIISEFLDYASDRPVTLGLCNLSEVVEETVLLLEARHERNVEIDVQAPRTLVCRGDPDKLKQVFLNLGLNAIEACGKALKIGHLRFNCAPSQGPAPDYREGTAVEVVDDGPGIPRDALGRVFDPFFTTKPRGVGMGLAIAKKIVQAHGGEITVNSQEGKGTAVRVWLPA